MTKRSFKADYNDFPNNYNVSKTHLKDLTKRFKCNKVLKGYNEIGFVYVKNGIIERVPRGETDSLHCLPHTPVIREGKETTKIRAAFNASSSSNGPSLNDCFYSDPNLLSKIFDVLLRLRLNKAGILADIMQAFLNLEICK